MSLKRRTYYGAQGGLQEQNERNELFITHAYLLGIEYACMYL